MCALHLVCSSFRKQLIDFLLMTLSNVFSCENMLFFTLSIPFRSTNMYVEGKKNLTMNYFRWGHTKKAHFLVHCSESCCQFSFTLALWVQCAQCKQFHSIEFVFSYLQWIFILKWIFSSPKWCTSPKRKYLLFCTLKYFSHLQNVCI